MPPVQQRSIQTRRVEMVAIGKQSVGSTANLFQGYWSHVEFRPGGYDSANARYLGVVQEGVLEVSREDVEYMGTTFPRVIEVLTPSQMGMKFSGQLDELTHTNMLIGVGNDANVDLTALAAGYIYPGSSCSFSVDTYGTLVARRKKCGGGTDAQMEAVLWKTVGSGALSIGGDADVVGTTVEFSALDDSSGEYMPAAAVPAAPVEGEWTYAPSSHPLGYLYAPAPAAGSTDPA
jgi:hypothetical protein